MEPEKPVLLANLQADGDVFWILLQQLTSVLQLASQLSISNEGEYYPTLSVAIAHTLQVIERLNFPQPDERSVRGTVLPHLKDDEELPLIREFRATLKAKIIERFVFLSGS